ncbi:MAG: VacB/RNase II family 3'-5' exoribonuclease [Clostridiales bacterium]|nr:VacB/RNase II family 3'-5' exoribonuclease [Clostridiales bacterium]
MKQLDQQTIQTILLETLDGAGKPVLPEHLPEMIGMPDAVKEVHRALAALQDHGAVIPAKKDRVISSRAAGLTPAVMLSLSEGFGFARTDEGEDVFIPGRLLERTLPGDKVLLKVRPSQKGFEGGVDRIVSRGKREFSGKVVRQRRQFFFQADSSIRFLLRLEGRKIKVHPGDKVLARVSCPKDSRLPVARVLHAYGDSDIARVCADSIVDAMGIPSRFSNQVLEEAGRIASRGISADERKDRLDLRGQMVMTIDGADAKDLDDAVSIQRLGDGYLLGVHIADVSHYVRPGSLLDACAFERATSVYFADRVIPMLPEAISNGVCSLNAGEDKLTLSALIGLDSHGEMVSFQFHKSVIHSKVRGVYSEVNAVFDGSASREIMKKYQPTLKDLSLMRHLAHTLKKRAVQRGAMELESTESAFVLDDEGRAAEIFPRVQGEAEGMIEQFMICANVAAAKYAKDAGVPFVYRVHERPDPQRIANLKQISGMLGFDTRALSPGVSPQDLSSLLRHAADTKYHKIISDLILRSMAKARYDEKPIGHFGLGLSDYCHFTSPIRRYPDTMVHRVLSELCKKRPSGEIVKRYRALVSPAAQQSTECEIRAMAAERQCEGCYKAEYMRGHLGETFRGVITSVAPHGVYVTLDNTVEGLVRAEQLPGCCQYDGIFCFEDPHAGVRFTVGDELTVVAARADVSAGQIDFDLAD